MDKDLIPTAQIDEETLAVTAPNFIDRVSQMASAHRQEGVKTRRQTFEFGYAYRDLLSDIDAQPTVIPAFLQMLYISAVESLKRAHPDLDDLSSEFNNCIVSVFEAGDCLQPHIDVDVHKTKRGNGDLVGFYFDENIIGVLIEADAQGRLYIQKSEADDRLNRDYDPDRALALDEKDGLVYLFHGACRHAPYYHGVSPVENRRVSVTFRTLKFR